MAASYSDITYVGPYAGSAKIWKATVNDTVANSQGSGYNSFWSPLAYAVSVGDVFQVTCNDGKWLGIVTTCEGAGINAVNWTIELHPTATGVTTFN